MKGMKMKENTKQDLFQRRSIQKSREKERCTFKPQLLDNPINKKTRSVFKDKKFLTKLINTKDEKLKERKSIRETKHKQDCTFQPDINRISREIIRNKSMDITKKTSVFEALHTQSKERQAQREKSINSSPKSCTFKPT